MKKQQWDRKPLSVSLAEAAGTLDPFAQKLVGLRVTDGVRFGEITAHECYDTDTCLCVERISVRWDDGVTERKSPRDWHGEAGGPTRDGNPPAYLRAVAK